MENQQITPDVAYTAIIDAIRTRFSVFELVTDYDFFSSNNQPSEIIKPACLLSIASLDVKNKNGSTATGQLSLTVLFEVRIILDRASTTFEQEMRRLVAEMSLWLHGNRFGITAPCARFLDAKPDQNTSQIIQFDPWVIQFQMPLHLGQSMWDDDEYQIPTTVMLGYEPDTGLDHITDYEELINDGLPVD